MQKRELGSKTLSALAAMGLSLGLAGACLSPAWAAEVVGQKDDFDTGVIEKDEVLNEKSLEETKIADVIGDQTMTLVGHGFVQGFQRAWRDHESAGESNIAIFERPSARWGSLVWVEQNFNRVYQTFLFPGRGEPVEVGESAARWVYQRIAEIEAAKLLFKDPDMEKEEF